MTHALVVPSYRRPDDLRRCLRSALAQFIPFDEIIVVARQDDRRTRAVAASLAGVRCVTTERLGVLAAMEEGTHHVRSALVTFTDDDAVLPRTFTAYAQALFRVLGRDVGGVGGRDVLFDGPSDPRPTMLTEHVGRVSTFGRVTGNHHCGTGPVQYVDMLKGVNATYRRSLVALPTGLRGSGAQPHFEIAVGQHVRSAGFRLVYDPRLALDHYPAPRQGEDQRVGPSVLALQDSAYNLMRSLPRRTQTRRFLYVLAVGDRNCPGLVRLLWALLRRQRDVIVRYAPSQRGTREAWRQRRTPLQFVTFQ